MTDSSEINQTHNQYIRQIYTNNFIGRKTQKKSLCRPTDSKC